MPVNQKESHHIYMYGDGGGPFFDGSLLSQYETPGKESAVNNYNINPVNDKLPLINLIIFTSCFELM